MKTLYSKIRFWFIILGTLLFILCVVFDVRIGYILTLMPFLVALFFTIVPCVLFYKLIEKTNNNLVGILGICSAVAFGTIETLSIFEIYSFSDKVFCITITMLIGLLVILRYLTYLSNNKLFNNIKTAGVIAASVLMVYIIGSLFIGEFNDFLVKITTVLVILNFGLMSGVAVFSKAYPGEVIDMFKTDYTLDDYIYENPNTNYTPSNVDSLNINPNATINGSIQNPNINQPVETFSLDNTYTDK